MARNERNEAVRNRFRGYAVGLAGAAVIAIVGLGLVHQHRLQHELAQKSRDLDRLIQGFEERIRQATQIEATLRSSRILEQRVRDQGLGLNLIQSTQRIYVVRSTTSVSPQLQAGGNPRAAGVTAATPADGDSASPGLAISAVRRGSTSAKPLVLGESR